MEFVLTHKVPTYSKAAMRQQKRGNMKIGVRAHDYGKRTADELARILHEEGYQAAQLALPRAIEGINGYGDITLKHLDEIRAAFDKYQVEIPVFSCYMDLGTPDRESRETAVSNIKKCLAYSKEVGAGMVGTETSYSRLTAEEKKIWYPHMLDSVKRVMDEAVRLDAKFVLEPVYWHPLENLEVVLDVIGQIKDEQHLRLIFDASNLLEFPETTDQNAYWKNWMESIGTYVDAMHIKDFCLDDKGLYQPTLLGEGVIDYSAISEWLHANRPDMYLLREGMNPETARQDMEFMRSL